MGRADARSGVPIIGPTSTMPSGGVFYRYLGPADCFDDAAIAGSIVFGFVPRAQPTHTNVEQYWRSETGFLREYCVRSKLNTTQLF